MLKFNLSMFETRKDGSYIPMMTKLKFNLSMFETLEDPQVREWHKKVKI